VTAPDSDDLVVSEAHGDVRVVTLRRPEKLNAANLAMQRQLLARWRELHQDDDIGAVVLTGAGRAFCAGGDRSLFQQVGEGGPVRAELGRIHRELLRAFLTLPVATIAAVNGPAVGFGAELAALCDLVVIDPAAYLADPHVQLGFAPSPGCQLVWPHLVSLSTAKELALTGRRVEAREALALGLANQVSAPGAALEDALALAHHLATAPPEATAVAKRGFQASLLDELARLEELTDW
jgi:enoyl-CoA hydratase